MNVVTGARLRRLIPVGSIAAVLAVAYMAPLPAQASKANNCGVKAGYGYAYHDHGKPCPNRPFPGHGIGALRHLGLSAATSEHSANATVSTKANLRSNADETSDSTDVGLLITDGDSSQGLVHGRGHGHGKSRGHANGLTN